MRVFQFGAMVIAVVLAAVAGIAAPAKAPPAAVGPKLSPSPHASVSARLAVPTRAPSLTPSPLQSLTPDEILGRTEAALRRNEDPTYIIYTMHEIFVHHGRRFEYTYHVWYRNDGKGLMQSTTPGRRGRPETFFGYPFPSAPDNNILLYATPPPVTPVPPPVGSPAPDTTNAPLLMAEPVHGDRYYVVALGGIEEYQGHQVYHLTLKAVSDEAKHPWKDLWVDTQSYEVWRAHADASGSNGPLSGRAVADVEFAPVGPYWLVKQASADAEGRFAFVSDSGHYEYYFSDFGFPMTLPDWYFDEAAFNRHRP